MTELRDGTNTVDYFGGHYINGAQIYRAWLHGLTYRPGWKFAIVELGGFPMTTNGTSSISAWGSQPALRVTAPVPDSNEPDRTLPLIHTLPLSPSHTAEEFRDQVLRLLVAIETHEAMEFFRLDGQRWSDPHANGDVLYHVPWVQR